MKYLIIFLLCSASVAAQTKMFSFQGDNYDQEEFDIKLNQIKETFSAQGSYKFTTVSYKLQKTELRNDTIFNTVEVILSQSNSAPLDITKGVQELIDKKIPAFQLQNLASELKAPENYSDKVTFINLWFTNCRPCITEIPYLNYLEDTYSDKVNFVAITFDNHDKVNQFLTRKDFNFEHLVDAGQYLEVDLKNNAYPRLILIDKQGIVRFVANGVQLSGNTNSAPQDAVTELQKQLDFLLAE